MHFLSLAAALALSATSHPPLPLDDLFAIAWRKALVLPDFLEYKPFELAGPQVDPDTGTVVVATRDGMVRAFSSQGAELWHYEGRGPYLASPGICGGMAVFGGTDGRLVAVDLATGLLRWQLAYKEEIGSQPLLKDGLIYVATLEGTVLALDAKSGAWKWHFRREPTSRFSILGVGNPVVANGLLVQGFADGSVVALDAKTGTVKWDRRFGRGDYPDVNGSIQFSGDRLYVASYGGQVAALDAANGTTIWETKVPFAYKCRLDGEMLFLVTTTSVVSLGIRDGKQLWSAPLEGIPCADPFPVRGMVLVPNGKGLLILDRRNGKRLRIFTRGSGASATPTILGKRLYGLSNAGELVAVDLK